MAREAMCEDPSRAGALRQLPGFRGLRLKVQGFNVLGFTRVQGLGLKVFNY